MVTLFVQNNIQKTRTQNTQWNQRYRWKRHRSMTRRNVRHFPPASGRMTPINVCLWRHREHGNSNKRWRQRRFEPSQETGVKNMINGNVSSEFISLWIVSVHGAANPSKTASRLWFYAYKSTRTVTLQDVQPHNVISGRPYATAQVTILVRDIRKITKNSNFKRHFLENGWSYHREILQDNLEDQVQWHF